MRNFALVALLVPGAVSGGEEGAAVMKDGCVAGVKVLAFDVFGTVVDWRSGMIAEAEAMGKRKGLVADWGAFVDAWRAEYVPSMDRARRGEMRWTRLDDLHRQSLERLLTRFSIDGLSDAEKDDLNLAWHRLRPWPDVVEGLTRLRRRFVITPLSNGNLSLLTDMAKRAGLPWDCILSAELVRHYKPDREVYLSVAEFFGIRPEAVMMVAAHPGDLRVPKTLGMRTAYVHRPSETPRGAQWPPAGSFDFLVSDFLELASVLGQ